MPAVVLGLDWRADALGPNPIERLQNVSGIWAIRLLLATLAVSPLFAWTKWSPLVPLRRTLGVAAGLYAVAHFVFWAWLDMEWDPSFMARHIAKKPFILAGAVGLAAILPLLVTSTNAAVKRLGARNWRALHTLAYWAGAAGVLHYFWKVKPGTATPYPYLAAFLALMAVRAFRLRRR